MKKRSVTPSTFLAPVPVALVTCRDSGGRPNVLTIAWTGVVCSDPPMVSVSIRPSRYSHGIIKGSGEFTVNIPPANIIRKVDMCGILSGRDVDKFTEAGLTAVPADIVSAPLIEECVVCLECRVTEVVPLGIHDMFLGEVLATHIAEEAVNGKDDVLFERVNPPGYSPMDRTYRALGDALGSYGFSRKNRE